MRTFDGFEIQYLLKRRGYTLTAVAGELNVSTACIHHVINGRGVSSRVVEHIERLLGWTPGKLRIARASNRKAA